MIEGSPNVFAEGIPVVRVGDLGIWEDPSTPQSPDFTEAVTGSPNVFVN